MPSSPAELLRRQHTIVPLRERKRGADALVSPSHGWRRQHKDRTRRDAWEAKMRERARLSGLDLVAYLVAHCRGEAGVLGPYCRASLRAEVIAEMQRGPVRSPVRRPPGPSAQSGMA